MGAGLVFQFSHDLVSVLSSIVEEREDEEVKEAFHHSLVDRSCHYFTGTIEIRYYRISIHAPLKRVSHPRRYPGIVEPRERLSGATVHRVPQHLSKRQDSSEVLKV